MSATTDAVRLFDEPVEPVVLELPSEAPPYWRAAAGETKPALVLFSIHPLLLPPDPALEGDLAELMRSGSVDDFHKRGSLYRSEALLMPTQAVSAAIAAGMIRELVWVFPTATEPGLLDIELFRRQLTEAGFVSDDEAAKLTLANGVFSGTARGIPFRAVHPAVLPEMTGPFILHVDLGFFRGLYDNEVKTPLYDILHDTANNIYEAEWSPQLTTLSYSTIEGSFSPDVRFLLSNFARLLRQPDLLDGNMPQEWIYRREALYAENFFLKQNVQELIEQAAREYPDDADAQYDLYKHLFFTQRKFDEAMQQLDKAVALDPGYVAAYLQLAEIARNDQNPQAALELLGKAAPLLPENPFIDFYRADFMIGLEQQSDALPLVERLQQLNWSKHFHPDVPEQLKAMAEAAKETK